MVSNVESSPIKISDLKKQTKKEAKKMQIKRKDVHAKKSGVAKKLPKITIKTPDSQFDNRSEIEKALEKCHYPM